MALLIKATVGTAQCFKARSQGREPAIAQTLTVITLHTG